MIDYTDPAYAINLINTRTEPDHKPRPAPTITTTRYCADGTTVTTTSGGKTSIGP